MAEPTRGLLDTNIVILEERLDVALLPEEMAISTITLAELAAGVHAVRDDAPDAVAERARRISLLQRVEALFDPLPFDDEAARLYGRVVAATTALGRSSRRRTADLFIASVAGAHGLPLYTTNPDDFAGLDGLVEVVPVPRP